MSTYAATLRGDALLLSGGHRGAPDDTLVLAAGVVLDAALHGLIDVVGARRLGIDRRRVVPGPNQPDARTAPLLADLRGRVERATPETPWGWYERAAVFAFDRVSEELVRDGAIERVEPPLWRRLIRHRAIRILDTRASDAAAQRVGAVAAGRAATPGDIALAGLLRETGFLGPVVGRGRERRIDAARRELPDAVAACLDALAEARKRARRIGS
jgi:hypothetical protein